LLRLMENKYKDLSEKKLMALARRGDKQAREIFVQRHQGLVVSLAKKYAFTPDVIDDLVVEGNMGLLRALEKFKPSHKVRFGTYAYFWIKRYILRAIMKEFELFKIPEKLKEFKDRCEEIKQRYQQTYGRSPTTSEVAQEMKMPVEVLNKFFRYGQHIRVSTSFLDDDGERTELFEVMDFSSGRGLSVAEMLRQKDLLESMFHRLAEKEKRGKTEVWFKVLKLHYGIGYSRPYSYKEIAWQFGISRQRVHQIIQTCLAKLQKEWRKMRYEKDSQIHQRSA